MTSPADVLLEDAITPRVERMPFTRWHLGLLGVLGSAHLSDAYDATALAYILPVLVGLWRLTPVEVGLLISAGYVGQLVGAVGAGALAERRGRIATLRLSLWLLSLLSLACALAPSYAVLLLLRLLQGIGLGAEPPVAATYLNETCSSRFRGRMVTFIAVVFATGAVAAAVVGMVLIPRFGWRSMFVVGALPAVLAMVLPRMLPESPRWLASIGRAAEAESALARIERAVFRRQPMPVLAPAIRVEPVSTKAAQGRGVLALLGPDLFRSTMSAWLIAVANSVVAYAIIAWMPTIYRTVYHQPIAVALKYGAIAGVVSVAGAVMSLFVVDRIGRRATIGLGFLLAGACMLALAVWGLVVSVFFVMVVISVAFMALGLPLSAQYAYIPELYPTPIRALGVGVATSWMRLASIVTPPVIGAMLGFGSVKSVYLMLAAACGAGLVAILVLGKETRTTKAVVDRHRPHNR